jgi:hypothetical protein
MEDDQDISAQNPRRGKEQIFGVDAEVEDAIDSSDDSDALLSSEENLGDVVDDLHPYLEIGKELTVSA